MAETAYIFVPYDGGREQRIADPLKVKVIDDLEKQTEFSARMQEQGTSVPFWLSDKGVMIHGTASDALKVSNIVSSSYAVPGSDTVPSVASAFAKAAESNIYRLPPRKPSIFGGYNGYTAHLVAA